MHRSCAETLTPAAAVAALTPAIGRDEQVALLHARINAIVQEPRGSVPISASTLSDDELLEPINVRRLFCLLRRVCLRRGAAYVFVPETMPVASGSCTNACTP